jgi:hypothetical protein
LGSTSGVNEQAVGKVLDGLPCKISVNFDRCTMDDSSSPFGCIVNDSFWQDAEHALVTPLKLTLSFALWQWAIGKKLEVAE